jgi:hypothetical protein
VLAWADGGYAGKLVTWASTRLRLRLDIVKRPDDLHTFQVLPAGGSWSGPWPGSPATAAPSATASDWPRTTRPTLLAMIIVMTRRLARKPRPAGTAAAGRISRHAAVKDGRIQLRRAGWGILLS